MPRMTRRCIYLLALTALTQPVCADILQAPPDNPWYFGLGIGSSFPGFNKSNIANSFSAATTSSSYNNDDFTFNIYGGYFLDGLLAVEFGFTELGDAIATTNDTSSNLFKIYSIYVNSLMVHRYNKNAAIYTKVGAHFWDIGRNNGSSLTTGTDLLLGTGVELNIYSSDNRVVRVGWTRYLLDKVYLDATDTVTLDLVFKHY